MKIKPFSGSVVFLFISLSLCLSVFGQEPEPGSFAAGQKVEVEYIPDSGKWFAASVVEVVNDGYSYKVKVAPYGDGKQIEANIHFKGVRAGRAGGAVQAGGKKAESGKLVLGKYGCTAAKYTNGSYEYIPRGAFVIASDGKYTYNGFQKPSRGTFTVDGKGNLAFKGGYLDKGQAEKIDRPNKFSLVFPTNPDNRWTCGLVEN